MLRLSRAWWRVHQVHPKAFAAASQARSSKLRAGLVAAEKQLQHAVVLEDLDATVRLSADSIVSARDLWNASRVARDSKHTRRSQGACVVGGAKAIQRIWRDYHIRPHVVYVPNTEGAVPSWCVETALPTYLVRSSPVEIRRQLLSAEYSDGYAAEFPWESSLVASAASLLVGESAHGRERAESGERTAMPAVDVVRSMVVLVGLRIPSNAGALIRAAVDMGYDSVVLVDCVDPFQEKVVRASEGTVFSPKLRVFESNGDSETTALLSAIAVRHRLLPLLAVPSQDAEPAFDVAKRFHCYNAAVRGSSEASGSGGDGEQRSAESAPWGPMVVLGSESQGLRSLGSSPWSAPHQVVTVPLPNAQIDSFNVTVAGSVLLNMFRRDAEPHFSKLAALAGDPAPLPIGVPTSLSD